MTSTAAAKPRVPSRSGSRRVRTSRWLIDAAVVVAITLAAIWLRIAALGPSSLWLDDAWVALVSRVESLEELRFVGFSAPGFAVLLRAWFAVVGFSETAAQALPFAAGVAAPAIAYLVGRRMAWRRAAAIVPALVLASSPMAMDYATRVKPYTIESVLALALLALAVHLLDDVRSTRRWAAFVGAAALATTVSAFLAPYAAAVAAAGLARALLERDTVALRRGIAAAFAYGAIAATWYLVVLAPVVTSSISAFWSGNFLVVTEGVGPALESVRTAAAGVAGGLSGLPVVLTVTGLLAAAVAVARRRPAHAALLVTPTVVAVVLAAVGAAPLGGGRTDIYLYPSLALLLGGGVQAMIGEAPRRIAWAVPTALVAGLMLVTRPVTPYPVQDVRPLIAELEERRADGDAVLLYPATMWAYALYTADEIALEAEPTSSWGFAPSFADAATYALPPGRDDPRVYLPVVQRATDGADRVWLLASHWRADYDILQQQLRDAGFARTGRQQRDGAQLGRWERS